MVAYVVRSSAVRRKDPSFSILCGLCLQWKFPHSSCFTRWHLHALFLQMSQCDLTNIQGTHLVVPILAASMTRLLHIVLIAQRPCSTTTSLHSNDKLVQNKYKSTEWDSETKQLSLKLCCFPTGVTFFFHINVYGIREQINMIWYHFHPKAVHIDVASSLLKDSGALHEAWWRSCIQSTLWPSYNIINFPPKLTIDTHTLEA